MKTIALLKTSGLLLFFLIIYTPVAQAQGWISSYPPKDTSNTNNIASKFTTTTSTIDGGILFCRQDVLPSQGNNFGRLNLVKVDQNGIEQWNRTYPNPQSSNPGIPSSADPMIYEVIQNPDGSYVLTGRYLFGEMDIFLTKIDPSGNLIWNNQYFVKAHVGNRNGLVKTQDSSYLQVFDQEIGSYGIGLRKTDDSGNLIWSNSFPTAYPNSVLKVIPQPGNTYEIITHFDIYTVDDTGNLISQRGIARPPQTVPQEVVLTPDGGYLFTGNTGNITIFKNDPSGVLEWDTTYSQFGGGHYVHPVVISDGGYVLTTTQGSQFNGNHVLALRIDAALNIIWHDIYPGTARDLIQIKDTSFVISGYVGTTDKTAQLIKLDKNGVLFESYLMGNVYRDGNLNCTPDQNEPGFNNWLVEAKGNYTFYGFADTLGNYSILVDSGSYDLGVITPGQYWGSCLGTHTVQVNQKDTVITDFPIKPLIDCPYLTVDVVIPFLRGCFNNNATVNYCNEGTLTATNASVKIELDQDLLLVSSTIPWSSQVGNTYSFPIGDLNINECGDFNIVVNPKCGTILLGQTLCIAATIQPDSMCITPDPSWDGSITDLNVTCAPDSLTFIIKNIGAGDMSGPLDYLVIEDNLISRQGFFQLDSQDSMLIKVPANGSTYRINAGQAQGYFPPGYNPTLAYEGCGVNANGTFSMGFVNMYPENDILPTEAVECLVVVGSYDPNDKQAAPEGYGTRHYIEVGDDLDYRIRFQNTGTDTAFTVVIRDTISEHLDMASILPGASSHSYDLDVINGNELKFTFNNILLVDSFTNEPASHGYVKFKISQQDSLPLGTLIYNDAAIYFDYNEPIITNRTYHEIGEDYIPTDPTAIDVKLFLEGAYDELTFKHRTELMSRGLLPLGQPYTAAPWNYSGQEGRGWTTVDYPAGTVDWVLISLRETLSPDSEVAKGAAVLLEDGSLHPFELVVPNKMDSVYVAVYHRNHLPALSPYKVDISNQQLSFDFRLIDGYRSTASFGQKQIGFFWSLFAGDGDRSGYGNDINASDKILWELDNGYFNKYFISDYDLNGDINGIDKILWNNNNGIYTEIR